MISASLRELLLSLDPYLKRKGVSDIILERPGIVLLDLGNDQWEEIKDKTINFNFLNDLPFQLATTSNQTFDKKNPTLATNIPGTQHRVNAVHHSIIKSGYTSVVIRRARDKIFTVNDFISDKLSIEQQKKSDEFKEKFKKADTYQKLELLVLYGKNVLVSGSTSSGKTSLLNALINFIPPHQRIITIEDAQELVIIHKNYLGFLISKTGTDYASTSYETLINTSMRMRPDRVFIGELDIRNVLPFLRLGNTGHDGMLSSIHANDASSAISALITNMQINGVTANHESMLLFISKAIDYVVHIKKDKYSRSISEIKSVSEIIKETHG
ncbi:MAG: ATPase, T2SS/T4P/T4SS family [Arcobacteraceae bacterium]